MMAVDIVAQEIPHDSLLGTQCVTLSVVALLFPGTATNRRLFVSVVPSPCIISMNQPERLLISYRVFV
jgi:hypothetical protein